MNPRTLIKYLQDEGRWASELGSFRKIIISPFSFDFKNLPLKRKKSLSFFGKSIHEFSGSKQIGVVQIPMGASPLLMALEELKILGGQEFVFIGTGGVFEGVTGDIGRILSLKSSNQESLKKEIASPFEKMPKGIESLCRKSNFKRVKGISVVNPYREENIKDRIEACVFDLEAFDFCSWCAQQKRKYAAFLIVSDFWNSQGVWNPAFFDKKILLQLQFLFELVFNTLISDEE